MLIHFIFSFTLETQYVYCLFLPSSLLCCFLFPLLQQYLQVRQKRIPGEIQQYLLRHFVVSVSISHCYKWYKLTAEKQVPSARRTKSARPTETMKSFTSGRAFAVSVLFSCQFSDPSYPPVSLSVRLLCQVIVKRVFLLVLFDLFLSPPAVLTHHFITYPSNKET